MNPVEKRRTYRQARQNIRALIAAEHDEIAVLATVAAEVSKVYVDVNYFASGET